MFDITVPVPTIGQLSHLDEISVLGHPGNEGMNASEMIHW